MLTGAPNKVRGRTPNLIRLGVLPLTLLGAWHSQRLS